MIIHSSMRAIALYTLMIYSPLALERAAAEMFPRVPPESVGLRSEYVQELSEIVEEYFEQDLIVGAELLVIKNRKTVLHTSVGWMDRENREPMALNTIFNIRSMSKPMTGASAQILMDEGKLQLDDFVMDYLPAFADWTRPITLRQLLTHRSGIPLSILSGLNDYPDLQSIAEAVGRRGPQFAPDSKFWYSDSGTDCVGAIVEVISGQLLNDYLQEHFFDPLDMRDSFSFDAGKVDAALWNRTASQYAKMEGGWIKFWEPDGRPWYPFAWGSQTVYSAPMDYAKFLAMWMDRGVAMSGERILSEEAMVRTLAPASVATSLGSDFPAVTGFPGLTSYYGQMAFLYGQPDAIETGDVEIIGHSGSDGTFAWGWPDEDLMVFYFTQSRGGTTGLRLERDIHRLLVQTAPEPIPEQYKPYIGTYEARGDTIEVIAHNGRLAADVSNFIIIELNGPNSRDRWYWRLDPNLSVSFHKDASGAVTTLTFHEGAQARTFSKAVSTPALDWRLH